MGIPYSPTAKKHYIDHFDADHLCVREVMDNGLVRTLDVFENTSAGLDEARTFCHEIEEQKRVDAEVEWQTANQKS